MTKVIAWAALWCVPGLMLAAGVASGAEPPMPAPARVADLTYWSGGVGLDEREYMLAHRADYNLHLKFAAIGGAYLAAVTVTIGDGHGRQLMSTTADGPWFFAKLPKGKYKLVVESGGEAQERMIDLSKKALADVVFRWKVEQVN
jgi:hypothetical protein